MKIKVAVLFGGKSVEHEISVISAIQAIQSINTDKYDVIPVYMTKDNRMYVGDAIGDIESYRKDIDLLLEKSQQVVFMCDGSRTNLLKYPLRPFKNNLYASIDVAFPIVHGTNVEDGALQGFLQTLNLPYVGCDVLSSAVGMDKYVMKAVLKDKNIPVLDCRARAQLFCVTVPAGLRMTKKAIRFCGEWLAIILIPNWSRLSMSQRM